MLKRSITKYLYRSSITTLRLFFSLVPSEKQRLLLLTILVGACCGLAAVVFHLSIELAEDLLINRALGIKGYWWIFFGILVPTLGGLICGWLLTHIFTNAKGSGIPQVKVAYTLKAGKISFFDALGKFCVSSLQIGSGGSLGREGPTVQICSGIASFLARIAALSPENVQRILPVGTAAGIAAAFNAPIAAVTFTIEEIVGDLDQTVLSGVVVAAALASVIERSFLGTKAIFLISFNYQLDHLSSLILYFALGLAAAVVSIIYTDLLLGLRNFFTNLSYIPAWMHPGVGGLVTGILIVVTLLTIKVGGINGGGYDLLSQALNGNLALYIMIVLCVVKIVATSFSYSSGGAGGIFAPTLFIGGMLGGIFGIIDQHLLGHSNSVGGFVLVGMGAVFAGVIRAPMTSVLIIFEMTGEYGLILPLMVANILAFIIARHWRPLAIYDALLKQDGVVLKHQHALPKPILEHIKVREAMHLNPTTVSANTTLQQMAEILSQSHHSYFPVIKDDNYFLGLISEYRVLKALAEGRDQEPVMKLLEKSALLFPDQKLITAVVMMNKEAQKCIAVVNREDPHKLCGILTMSDILQSQAQIAEKTGLDNSLAPASSTAGMHLAK